jgi:PAS domain S-box-containing protein
MATGMGIVTHFNKGAETLLGYKAEEIIGKKNLQPAYQSGVTKYTEELSIEVGKN